MKQVNKVIKCVIFLLLILAVIYYGTHFLKNSNFAARCKINSIAQSTTTKKELWRQMEREVDSWIDGYGTPIDEKIKNTVIILNLLGFKTIQSCEGHVNESRPYPWVSMEIEDADMKAMSDKKLILADRIQKIESDALEKNPGLSTVEIWRKGQIENNAYYLELLALYEELKAIDDQKEKIAKLKMLPLRNLIYNFYKNHPINPNTMLVLTLYPRGAFEISSIGASWQIIYDENKKLVKLKEFQQEMQAFTHYLINYYFENE